MLFCILKHFVIDEKCFKKKEGGNLSKTEKSKHSWGDNLISWYLLPKKKILFFSIITNWTEK